MILQSKYTLAAATFATALGAGYIMQNGNSISSFFSGESIEPQTVQLASATLPAVSTTDATTTMRVPTLPVESLMPAPRLPDAPTLARGVQFDESIPRDDSPDLAGRSAFGLSCDVDLQSFNNGAAMVQLSLNAPCHINERVDIIHEGLVFSTRTSNIGKLEISVPALTKDAVFNLRFTSGETVSSNISVQELAQYDRVALTWNGNRAIHIHALEFGSAYGGTGHVWYEAPRTIESALQATGGFLTRLGDTEMQDPFLAEIYSFPTKNAQRNGVVRLNVEAEVTPRTCGKDIAAKALQLQADTSLQWIDLELAMPGCDAIGDFLVLNNLLQDLKIAQN